jgi:hypothetical protein
MAPETPSTPPSPPSCGQAVTPQSLGRAAAIGLAAAGAAYVVLSLVSSKMPAILRDLSNAFDAYSEVVELTTRASTGRAVLVASLSAAVSLLLSARSFYARPPDVAARRISPANLPPSRLRLRRSALVIDAREGGSRTLRTPILCLSASLWLVMGDRRISSRRFAQFVLENLIWRKRGKL